MGLTAILFPGHGSQTPDMRDLVGEPRPDLQVLTGLAKRTLRDVEPVGA